MMWTDDPHRDFDEWDAENAAWLKSRPVCYECGEPITEDYAYRIGGDLVCQHCIDEMKESI